jgi:hypothetical protein
MEITAQVVSAAGRLGTTGRMLALLDIATAQATRMAC